MSEPTKPAATVPPAPAEVSALGTLLSLGEVFDGWVVEAPVATRAGVAEHYLVKKDGRQGVLKYYRWKGIPKEKVLAKWTAADFPGIVRLLASGSHKGLAYEVTEACAGGTLDSRDDQGKFRYLPWGEDRATALVQVLNDSFRACHGAGLLHRNLKPSNIYLRNADGTGPTIGDFGTITLQDPEGESTVRTATLSSAGYSAPEVYSGVVGPEVDYYSLGITLFEVLTGVPAFGGINPQIIIRDTIGGRVAEELLGRSEARGFSPRIRALVEGLLNSRHDKRWGAVQVEEWLKAQGPATGLKAEATAPPQDLPPKTATIGPESWNQDYFDDLGEGSQISLKPGQYRGSIVLKTALKLASLDPKEPAVLFPSEAVGDQPAYALRIVAPGRGTLSHLVIRGESFTDQVLLKVEAGQWSVDACQFKGAYDHALIGTGKGTDPQVKGCTIHGGNTGVLVEAGCTGTFERNDILDHIKNNVVVQGVGTNPRFRNNKVFEGRQCGFYVAKEATGTYEENDVHSNTLANVLVRDEDTAPIFKNNTVHDGKRGGFYILEGASGSYEGNDVFGNSTSNIEVKDRMTDPLFKVNRVHDGKQGGISIYGGATGTYEGNEVFGNALANVFVFQSHTDPSFKLNRVHDGKHAGFSIYGGASGIYEENDIYGNAQANIIIFQPGTSPAFVENRVHSGKQGGFFIHGGAGGNFEGNEIFDNVMANIEVLDNGTNPIFKKNKVHSCLNEGLFIQNGAAGRFDGNEFNGNGFSTKGLKDAGPGYPSIRIKDHGTSPLFVGNRIIGFAASAFEISKGASGTYDGNIILDFDKDNNFVFEKKWDIKFGTNPKRKNNTEN